MSMTAEEMVAYVKEQGIKGATAYLVAFYVFDYQMSGYEKVCEAVYNTFPKSSAYRYMDMIQMVVCRLIESGKLSERK